MSGGSLQSGSEGGTLPMVRSPASGDQGERREEAEDMEEDLLSTFPRAGAARFRSSISSQQEQVSPPRGADSPRVALRAASPLALPSLEGVGGAVYTWGTTPFKVPEFHDDPT